MKVLASGFWGTTHWALDLIGRGAARAVHKKSSLEDDEAYSMTGGAAVGGIYGAIFGFLLSLQPRDINAVAGAALGCLLGICTGIMFGAIVQVVDDWIQNLLKSVDPK